MSKTISMTVPDRIHAALTSVAKSEFEQEPSEYLRGFLQVAAMSPDGARLKLHLPPVSASPDPKQPDLFTSQGGRRVRELRWN